MEITLKDVIERLRAEGQLTRNTGTNSMKAVIEKLSEITPIFTSIENLVKEQTSIIAQSFNLSLESLEAQKRSEDLSSVDVTRPINNNGTRGGDVSGDVSGSGSESRGSPFSLSGIFSSSFLGTGLGSALSAIMSPLKNLFKLVARNGPLAIVVGLLYSVFRDIGENENFRNTIESIKNVWNDSILPIFERLKDTVNNLLGTGSFTESLSLFREKWDHFRKTFQDFVLFTVEDIFQAIGGIFDGIGMLLNGEWKEGISKIVNSVLIGIQNIADNAITGILRLFGVDFGEDGSFLGWLDNKWSGLLDNIYNIWENFTTSIGEQWERAKTFLKETFDDFTKPIRDAISSAFSVITDLFSFGEEDVTALGLLGKLTDIVYAPVNMVINYVRGMFGFSSDDQEPFKLNDFIAEKMNQAMNWIKESMSGFGEILGEKFQQLADYISSVPDRVALFAEGMFVDVSEKLQIGFLTLGNWIASIPSRIRLMALNAIRSATSGLPEWAQIVSQSDIADAEQAVRGRESELEESTSAIRASAAESRAGIERRMAELDRVDQAAVSGNRSVVMINQSPVIAPSVQNNIRGGSNTSQTNISGGGGSFLDYGLPRGPQ
jgi:hypothetical protein